MTWEAVAPLPGVRILGADLAELYTLTAGQPDDASPPEAVRQIIRFALEIRRQDHGRRKPT